MRAIAGYRGDFSTEFALKLLPLNFVRPGELSLAEWRIPSRPHEDARAARRAPLYTGVGTLAAEEISKGRSNVAGDR
jgi:hypothetical protein